MGKEAKIGLAVILILLITFGVVLARRLNGAADRPVESSSAEQAKNAAQPQAGPTAKNSAAKSPAPAVKRPTVVAAKAVSNRNAKPSSAVASQWNVASDGNKAAQGPDGGRAQASPPFPMPKPPQPVPADPFDRYGNPRQSTPASQAAQRDRMGTAAGQPYDPFPSGPAQMAPDGRSQLAPAGPGQSGQTPNQLRVLSPPDQPAQQPGAGRTWQDLDANQAAQRPVYPTRSEPFAPARQFSISDSRLDTGSPLGAKGLRREDGTYEVQPNDNYWVISEKLYGSGAYFKALAEHNLAKVPQEDRLQVGDVISAPDVEELEKDYPGLCPKPGRQEVLRNRVLTASTRHQYAGGRTYTVEEGDTLFDIARYELGKASRWSEIHELNRDVLGDDYDLLTPGMKLLLPDDGNSPESVTRIPDAGSVYRQ